VTGPLVECAACGTPGGIRADGRRDHAVTLVRDSSGTLVCADAAACLHRMATRKTDDGQEDA
jgi:hypothetical protein